MKTKDLDQILREAYAKLPDAKEEKGNTCIVVVYDGIKNVEIEFKKYESGWRGGRVKK